MVTLLGAKDCVSSLSKLGGKNPVFLAQMLDLGMQALADGQYCSIICRAQQQGSKKNTFIYKWNKKFY